MAEITRTRDHDPYGDVEYCVEWEDNAGARQRKYFPNRRLAGQFALDVEQVLLGEIIADFNKRVAEMTSDQLRAFNEMLAGGKRDIHRKE